MTAETNHEGFIRQTIALAGEARAQGNHPFGALLVVLVLRDSQECLCQLLETLKRGRSLWLEANREGALPGAGRKEDWEKRGR